MTGLKKLALGVAVAVACGCGTAFGQLLGHPGQPTNIVWETGSVHEVSGYLVVPDEVTLTIEPGATVRFSNGAGLYVSAGGRCVAGNAMFTLAEGGSSYYVTGNVETDVGTQWALGVIKGDARTRILRHTVEGSTEDGGVYFGDTSVANEVPYGSSVLFWNAAEGAWSSQTKTTKGWGSAAAKHILMEGDTFLCRPSSVASNAIGIYSASPLPGTALYNDMVEEYNQSYRGDATPLVRFSVGAVTPAGGEAECRWTVDGEYRWTGSVFEYAADEVARVVTCTASGDGAVENSLSWAVGPAFILPGPWPAAVEVEAGEDVTLTVGTSDTTWEFDGENIIENPGAVGPIPSYTWYDAGSETVVASGYGLNSLTLSNVTQSASYYAVSEGVRSGTATVTVSGGGMEDGPGEQTIDGVTWRFYVSNGVATVTGGEPGVGALAIPEELGRCPVVVIDDRAFEGCAGLTSVVIPDSVKWIRGNAFAWCYSMASVSGEPEFGLCSVAIGKGVTAIGPSAFMGCSMLQSINIPDGLESIGDEAFADCWMLTTLTLPDSVRNLGENVFLCCSGLKTLSVPGGWKGTDMLENAGVPEGCEVVYRVVVKYPITVEGWLSTDKSEAEAGETVTVVETIEMPVGMRLATVYVNGVAIEGRTFTMPAESVTVTGDFEDDPTAQRMDEVDGVIWWYTVSGGEASVTGAEPVDGRSKSLLVPANLGGVPVTGIADRAFENCEWVTGVYVGYDAGREMRIGNRAFAGCSALGSLQIYSEKVEIGEEAFRGGGDDVSVSIRCGNALIGPRAFLGCRLIGLQIQGVVVSLGEQAFADCGGRGPDVSIAGGDVAIGVAAFEGSDLERLSIGGDAFSIGADVFNGCSGLTQVWLGLDEDPVAVSAIGDHAFAGCSGLTKLVIPDGVTSLGTGVFEGCSGLSTLSVPGAWKGTGVLDGAGVPEGCEVVYRGVKYPITVEGWLSTDKSEAEAGETVTVVETIEMPVGMRLATVYVNGVAIEGRTFTMPAEPVTVTAEFEWEEVGGTLSLELETASVREGAGSVRCVVRRTGATNAALTVLVASSRTGDVRGPGTVAIPAGAKMKSFTATVVDNAVLDGDRTAVISVSAEGYGTASAELTVLDDEVPTLKLEAESGSVREGETLGLLVTREGSLEKALEVNLSGFPTSGRVTGPSSVTIRAGEPSARFEVSVPDNDTAQGEASVALRASAAGYGAAVLEFVVEDDDVPGVRLELLPDEVGEGAGVNAVLATLSRTDAEKGLGKPITVQLAASPAGQVVIPTEVTIPANTLAVRFGITPVDNGVVDADWVREVAVEGLVAIASCGCGGQPSNGESIRAVLRVVDNDVPSLSLRAEPTTMKEGLAEAGWLVLGHNSALAKDLTVALSFDPEGEIAVPATATIPAGKTEVRVPVRTLDDGVEDGGKPVVVRAEDPSGAFTPASTWLQVSDQNLPDLAVASVKAAATAVTRAGFAVRFAVTNAGFAACTRSVPYAVHVVGAQGAVPGSNTVAATGTLPVGGGLPAGGTLETELEVTAPDLPGDAWVAVVLDPDGLVPELDNANNTGWSGAVGVATAWTATVAADAETYLPGDAITLSGSAALAGGGAATGVEVDVYLLMDGIRRTLKVTTGTDGAFRTVFTPSAGEAGHYAAGACYPGAGSQAVQDEFDVLGLRRAESGYVIWDVTVGQTVRMAIPLKNASKAALSGLSSTTVGVPAGCEVTCSMPNALAGDASATLYANVLATEPTGDLNRRKFHIRISSAEGTVLEIPIYFHARSPGACLAATPASLAANMTIGVARYLAFELANIGQGDTGKIEITGAETAWMRLVEGNRIANLGPGETATLTIELMPNDSLTLNQPYRGTFGIRCENGRGVSMPVTFTPVSETTGSIEVEVTNDAYWLLESRPHLEGATVRIHNIWTGETVFSGTTGKDGTVRANNIPSGDYQLTVSAPKNSTHMQQVTINPGASTHVWADLQFQAISINWEAEKTTVTDAYDVNLLLEYETSVPIPILKVVMPDKIPEPPPCETVLFPVYYINESPIPVQNPRTTCPPMPTNIVMTPPETDVDSVPGGGMVQTIWKVTRTDRTPPKWDCIYPFVTDYKVVCGPDGRPVSIPTRIRQIEVCPTTPSSWPLSSTNTTNTTNQEPISVSVGGGGWGGWGTIGIGGGGFGGGGFNTSKTDCDPVRAAGREAGKAASGWLKVLGELAWDFIPFSSCVDVLGNTFRTIFPDTSSGLAIIDEHWKGYRPSQRADIGRGEFAALKDVGLCIGDALKKLANAAKWTIRGAKAAWNGIKGVFAGFKAAAIGVNTELNVIDEILKPALAGDGRTPVTSYGGNMPDRLLLEDSQVVDLGNSAYYDIMEHMFPESEWGDVSVEYAWEIVGIIADGWGTGEVPSVNAESVATLAPPEVPREAIDNLVRRCNEGLAEWVETGECQGDGIDFNVVLEGFIVMELCQEYARHRGFDDCASLFRDVVRRFIERADGDPSDSVCARVKVELSQTVALAREAVEGRLTIYNGHESTAMTDVLFDVTVKDEEGNVVATADNDGLFGITQTSLEGMAGESILDGDVSVSAQGTGTATVLFVPTPDAAGEVPVPYRFGGTVTYTDPFTGERATMELIDVTLTVNPTPELHLDYFVQRDVYSYDPGTPETVEASIPAELAVLVRNEGWGDAQDVRISSMQPAVVEDENGLVSEFRLCDYSQDAMALNGATAHLGLNNVSLGSIPAKGMAVAQWWLTSSIQGHFSGMAVTKVAQRNSWGNPDTSLLQQENVRVHKLIRSVVADADGLPDFLTSEEDNLYGLADTIWTSAGAALDVSPAGNVSVSGSLAGGEAALSVRMTATVRGWTYGWKALPGAERYEIVRVVRANGSEVPLRNAWITDRVFQDGEAPVWETRVHLLDECAAGEQAYAVTLQAKAGSGPAVVSFGGLTNGAVVSVSPDGLSVVFSADVDGATFGTEDLTLRHQGTLVENLSGLRITGSGTRWTVSGLGSLCAADGLYELVVQAAGIAGTDGVLGSVGRRVSWTVCGDATGPTVLGVVREPQWGGEMFRVALNEAAATGTLLTGTVTLTRNGTTVALPGGTVWTDDGNGGLILQGLESVTGVDGTYVLTVKGSGLQDVAGHAGSGSVSVSWTVDTTPPAKVSGLRIDPDLGESATDGVTSEASVTVRGTLAADAKSVTVAVLHGAGAETVLAGPFTPASTELACAVELPGTGNMTLAVRCEDASENASETTMDVYLDTVAAEASWDAVEAGTVPVDRAVLRFAPAVAAGDVTRGRLSLTRDGRLVPLKDGVMVAALAGAAEGTAFEVTGLAERCARAGRYALRFDAGGVRKASSGLAAPAGAGASVEWEHVSPDVLVAGLSARQRYPWNGLVDIDYEVGGAGMDGAGTWVEVAARDAATGNTMPLWSLEGDGADGPVDAGTHRMTWDMVADRGGEFASDALSIAMAARRGDAAYLVVDMSGGREATHWPVSGLPGVPAGGWTDEYKTDKLVLRRVPAGTFAMGSPEYEAGRAADEVRHTVTLTRTYWMGVFEVTQKQWELAMGTRPAGCPGETRPVEGVSWRDIRGSNAGAGWPGSGEVDAGSFLGVLRGKTRLVFDLPTEAQWERACRAGSTAALGSGKPLGGVVTCPEAGEVAKYAGNGARHGADDGLGGTESAHAPVGSYRPNAWGLYDMHGNVAEWCLDWIGDYTNGMGTDPVGAASGMRRVVRGGGWESSAMDCRSAARGEGAPGNATDGVGFRLCWVGDDVPDAREEQRIEWAAIGPQNAEGSVVLDAVAEGGGRVEYEVVSGPAMLAGNVLTFTGPGTVTVRATQAGDGVWVAASAVQTIVVRENLTGLSVSGASIVESGGSATYTCTATYSDGTSKSVTPTWSLVSGASYGSITTGGVFTANGTSVERSVSIRASFGGKTATKTVTVVPVVTGLAISGATSVNSGGSATYTCTATYSDGTSKTVTPTWSLVSGASYGNITAGGVFTANGTSAERSVAIQASFGGKTATKTVTVVPVVTGLAISGATSVNSGGSATYTCTATYSDGTSKSVTPTWSLVSGASYASITVGGVFMANATSAEWSVTIQASFGGKTATMTVTVAPVVTGLAISGATSVNSGGSTTYTCTATYSDGTSKSVTPTWSLVSGASYGSITTGGVFTAIETSVERSVSIQASFGGKTATKAVTVVPVLTGLSISGASSVESGGSVTYTCTATYSDGTSKTVTPTWSLVSGASYGSITVGGVFMAKGTSVERSVTIQASFGGKTATKTVTVVPVVTGLSISGATSVNSGENATYTCTAAYSDGTSKSVTPTWSLVSGASYASITVGGVFMANATSTKRSVTIQASFGGKTATKAVTVVPVGAGTELVGEASWKYLVADATATVTGVEPAEGNLVIPSVLGGCPVTGVGSNAFNGCKNLVSVVIPNGITNIGHHAFSSCRSLVEVTLPETVTRIESYAFWLCDGLLSVTIPDRVTDVGNRAFDCCWGLTSLQIGNSVTNIGAYAFDACYELSSVTIPDSVKTIGYAAFSSCKGLTTLTIPDSVVQLDVHAFSYCTGLRSVTIGKNVSNIGEYAFWACTNLALLTIPDSVTNVGENVVGNCNSLKTLSVPGAWKGTDKLANAGVPEGCQVVYRGTEPLYMVVDLSGGTSAASYPVSYLADVPSGGWTDEYKTTKLVLRRIEPGTFTMGSPTNEVGRYDDSSPYNEIQHEVTITQPFYMGVFEVTQRQWELVMGRNPSCYTGDTRPVEMVSWNDIRGNSLTNNWPLSSEVDAASFMGRLQAKAVGFVWDLPTEAQWEYACRAGTATALNSGKNLTSTTKCLNMAEVGRYYYNRSDGKGGYTGVHTTVGSYLPNAWGLYDMHGNVCEWCLDWEAPFTADAGTDPAGPVSGSYRVLRSGYWSWDARACRSASRACCDPSCGYSDLCLRLCCFAGQR